MWQRPSLNTVLREVHQHTTGKAAKEAYMVDAFREQPAEPGEVRKAYFLHGAGSLSTANGSDLLSLV